MVFFMLLGFTEATYRMATDTIQLAPDEIAEQYEVVPDEIKEKETV